MKEACKKIGVFIISCGTLPQEMEVEVAAPNHRQS